MFIFSIYLQVTLGALVDVTISSTPFALLKLLILVVFESCDRDGPPTLFLPCSYCDKTIHALEKCLKEIGRLNGLTICSC